MTPYPSDPIDIAALKKLAPVAENFQIFSYELIGEAPNTVLRARGAVLRAATRGPRKGQLCIPVSGTERECFLTRADTGKEPAAREVFAIRHIPTGKEPAAREVFAIRHIPTGEYMPTKMSRAGAGGWSNWIPGPLPEGYCGHHGFDKNPRLFYTLRSAQNALTSWLMGVHSRNQGGGSGGWGGENDYYDEHEITPPPVPRVREDMEIVPLQLVGLK